MPDAGRKTSRAVAAAALALIAATVAAAAPATNAATGRVWRRADGAAALWGVPSEVQRAPGWCAPATLARALAFEGAPATQEELAEAGGCAEDRGASLAAFYRGVAPLLAARGLRLRAWRGLDPAAAVALARAHDEAAAARGSAARLAPPDGAPAGDVDLEALFRGADPDALRTAAEPRLASFRSAVDRAIGSGHPLLWGVVLGIVPERGPNAPAAPGGHLRLLVGRDAAAGTVLYTDPWGPDCPVKAMPEADACAITMSLHSLEPAPPPDPAFAALLESILPDAPGAAPDEPPEPDGRFAALVESILPSPAPRAP